MRTVRYDDTFEGLLCALDEALGSGSDAVAPSKGKAAFLFEEDVATDPERARLFRERLVAASSGEVLRRLWLASLSGTPFSEGLFVAYCRRAFTVGPDLLDDHGHPAVRAVHILARAVSVEAHRLAGFLRFSRHGALWYAPCEPDHGVLPLLGRHFAGRFPDDDRIIHDLRREAAALCRGGHFRLTALPRSEAPAGDDDPTPPLLWQTYFSAATNEARRNERLQRNRMPRRYWKHLVEHPSGESGVGFSGEGP